MTRQLQAAVWIILAAGLPATTFGQVDTRAEAFVRSPFEPAKVSPSTVTGLQFTRQPSSKRVRRHADTYLGGDIDVLAEVEATDAAGQPVRGVPVTLRVRSPAGPIVNGQGITGGNGRAPLRAEFRLSPGSLELVAQACLADNPGVCTARVPISLRQWISVDLSVNVGWVGARAPKLPEPEDGVIYVPLVADGLFQSALTPRVQVNVWESERNFRYRRLSFYGNVPMLFQNRTIFSILGPNSLDSQFGIGDYETGMEFQFGRRLFLNAAYNGRSGKINLVDSIRETGEPRPVNLGDGFKSVDLAATVQHPLSPKATIFVQGFASRSMPREFAGGDQGERRPYYRVSTGVLLPVKGGSFGWTLWAARSFQGETTLIRNGELQSLSPSTRDYLAGATFRDLRGGPVAAAIGIYVGGLGEGREYLGVNLNLEFRDLGRMP